MRSYEDLETFDRYVAEIWIPATLERAPEGVELLEVDGARWWSLADVLLVEKLAKPYVG